MRSCSAPLRLFLVVLVSCAVSAPVALLAAARVGQPAPDFRLTTVGGQSVNLQQFRGQVLLLDFFTTWCQPCREAVPHLNDLSRKYGSQGLQVIGVCSDDDGEKGARIFAEQNRVSYPVALAGESVLSDFGVRSVPILFVLDRRGRVAEIFRGTSAAAARSQEQLIRKLLSEK